MHYWTADDTLRVSLHRSNGAKVLSGAIKAGAVVNVAKVANVLGVPTDPVMKEAYDKYVKKLAKEKGK